MPMPQDRKQSLDRRAFLRALGAGAGASVAGSAPSAGPAAADTETDQEKRKARYRETEHVKTYYRVNRYPMK
jgi:nitrous oxide reductase